jgi:hypothetical protein
VNRAPTSNAKRSAIRGPVIATAASTPTGATTNRAWTKICTAAGVVARLHDLRHACGTYLAAEGVHKKAIQTTLRHARMATTEIYIHAQEETNRAAAETMDAIVSDLRRAARGKAVTMPLLSKLLSGEDANRVIWLYSPAFRLVARGALYVWVGRQGLEPRRLKVECSAS